MDGVDLMGRPKKYAPEEIVAKLRQVELMTAQGVITHPLIVRKSSI